MDLAQKKKEIIEWISQIDDEALISAFDEIKRNKTMAESYQAKLKPMSMEQYVKTLQEAQVEYKNGQVTTQEDLEKESENW